MKRNAFTDKVLPIVAVAVSVALAVSFDYRTILLTPHGGANYFSIVLIVITFVVVPAIAYLHYYRGANGYRATSPDGGDPLRPGFAAARNRH